MTPIQGIGTFIVPIAIVTVLLLAISLLSFRLKIPKKVLPIAILLLSSTFAMPANAISYGVPLDTSTIRFFSYYKETGGFNLTTALTAFETYTNHGNYIDGTIRIWQDTTGDTYTATPSIYGGPDYWDVYCRLRSDGWVMTWINNTATDFPHFAYYGMSPDVPTINSGMSDWWSSLGRAIERIYYVTGLTFPGYDQLYLYDFTHPLSTKLVVVQMISVWEVGNAYARTIYSFIPSTNTLDFTAVIWWGRGKADAGGTSLVDFNPGGQVIVNFNGHDINTWETGYVALSVNPDTTYTWAATGAGDSDNALYFTGLYLVELH